MFTVLFSYMAAGAVFFQTNPSNSWELTLSVSLYSALAVAPVGVIFPTAFQRAFSKYATFKGRASRSEFWFVALGSSMITFSVLVLSSMFGVDSNGDPNAIGSSLTQALFAWYLGSAVPAISLLVRRLHDTGHSGWFYWIILIPLIGAMILLVSLAKKSDVVPNQFGPAS